MKLSTSEKIERLTRLRDKLETMETYDMSKPNGLCLIYQGLYRPYLYYPSDEVGTDLGRDIPELRENSMRDHHDTISLYWWPCIINFDEGTHRRGWEMRMQCIARTIRELKQTI